MIFWQKITNIQAWLKQNTNKEFSTEEILEVAMGGGIRVGAVIPDHDGCGNGELFWFRDNEDYSVHPNSIVTDGIARWLTPWHLELLIMKGKVKLSGLKWTPGGPDSKALTSSTDSQYIGVSDIRIPKTELPLLLEQLLSQVAAKGKKPPEPSTSPDQAKKRPTHQQPFQEQEILRVIRELGYDPMALPDRLPGKGGVKAEVRHKLTQWNKTRIFEKAWERLRDHAEIKGGE